MRANIYNTQVAFSADDLIACQCSCRCGAEKQERILCVHPLALVMDLFLLLFEGLAQNILLELRDRIQNDWPSLLDDKSGSFFNDIKVLSGVAGLTGTFDASSIADLLTEVTVGTALAKRVRGRPNPKDLGRPITKSSGSAVNIVIDLD